MAAHDLLPPSPEDGPQGQRETPADPLTSDERTRAADLFEAHAGALHHLVAARFPGADPHLVSEAVVWALMRVSRRFERYDPAQGPLHTYLFRFAHRRLAALLLAEQR